MTEEKKKSSLWELIAGKQQYSTALLMGTLVLGIFLLGINRLNSKATVTPAQPVDLPRYETDITRTEKGLEDRLQQILSQIEGAGRVDVSIFLASGTRYEYAINVNANQRVIDEKDQGGGIRLTTENNSSDQFVLIRGNQSGEEQAVIIQEKSPQIQGVLVVAEGAKNPEVKLKLLRAVQTALGLDLHRIQVLPKGSR